MTDTILYAGGGITLLLVAVAVAFIVRQRSNAPSGGAPAGKSGDIFAQYRAQAAQNPKDSGIQLKWGYALAARAGETRNMTSRAQIYKEAAEHFRLATELTPSLAVAWKNLGQTLYIMFRLDNCEDRVVLANANAAYESAVKLNALDASLWQQWGEDLYMAAAYCKKDEKKDELVSLAKTRYAKAVALSPSLMEDWKSWGGSSAALEEVQAAAQRQGDKPAGLGEYDGDALASTGTRPPLEQAQGAMPWELEADIDDPEKFFSAPPASAQPARPAGAADASGPPFMQVKEE